MYVYVIKRTADSMYVAKPGSHRSYTCDRQQAAEFRTAAEAQREACGNESIWMEPAAAYSKQVG